MGRFSTRPSSLDSNLNFERAPLKLQEKKREKEKEGKRVLSKYITCEKLIQGQSDFLGQDFGKIRKISDV